MKNLISQSPGWFIPDPKESKTFIGQTCFVYREGMALFTITHDCKILSRGHGLKDNQTIPVFLHRDFQESLHTHTWYCINGKVSLSKKLKSAFFLPELIIGEIAPQEIEIKGEFIMPADRKIPLFKIIYGKMVPIGNKGLAVFSDFRANLKGCIPGKTYYAEGRVYVPEGNKAGVFFQTSLVQIS